MRLVLEVFFSSFFLVGKERKAFQFAVVDLKSGLENCKPVIVVRELQLFDVLAPREQTCLRQSSAACKHDRLLEPSDRVVEVAELLLVVVDCNHAPPDVIEVESMPDFAVA